MKNPNRMTTVAPVAAVTARLRPLCEETCCGCVSDFRFALHAAKSAVPTTAINTIDATINMKIQSEWMRPACGPAGF
jgi:hypothetical protein